MALTHRVSHLHTVHFPPTAADVPQGNIRSAICVSAGTSRLSLQDKKTGYCLSTEACQVAVEPVVLSEAMECTAIFAIPCCRAAIKGSMLGNGFDPNV